jgi:cation-transporting ATPase 13A2
MTVIAHDLSCDKRFAYTKGAPEVIKTICCKKSIPQDYDKILDMYAKEGYRILGVCYKDISKELK